MPHKTNNYISKAQAQQLAEQQAYFQRNHNKKGGTFTTNNGTWKVNENVFKIIQPILKPRN